MKDRSKEQQAAALLGELLMQLAQRDDIKGKLGELTPSDVHELVNQLLDEFGDMLDKHRLRTFVEDRLKKGSQGKLTLVPRDDAPGEEKAPPVDTKRSGRQPLPPITALPPLPTSPSAPITPLPPVPGSSRRPGESRTKSEEDINDRAIRLTETIKVPPFLMEPSGSSDLPPIDDRGGGAVKQSNRAAEVPDPGAGLPRKRLQRIRVELSDEDSLYLHGFSNIPFDQETAAAPFMLEEKGIEEKEFACAIDVMGIRVYLSRLQGSATNVSKKGVLLLNKQDSVRWHGVHESILNELRNHGTLVPFEFGTVALGLDDLRMKIQLHHDRLAQSLEEMQATTWWNLSVFSLDARMAQLVSSEANGVQRRQEFNRKSYSLQQQAWKYDIKTLERILGKQKKIAESIHEELSLIADRSDIDQIIGLGSGTSDEWKLILRASYEVPAARLARFNRAISESQYRHLLFEIMLSIAGNVESFSFHGVESA